MPDKIVIKGIQTNNLKNIDVTLFKNTINLIIGPSGSGKSSLAYDTIAQIGLHELSSMFRDNINEPLYKVQSFSNMSVAIPLKQINNNNNVRSTIGTYFSLNQCLAKIYSSILDLPYDYFVLNKSENVCPECLGVGYTKKLDPIKLIDYSKRITDVPIRCWTRNKDFYKKILELFCKDNNISTLLRFSELNDSQKELILYGASKVKYKIKYKVTNHFSVRTTQYFGPLSNKPMLKNHSFSDEFYSELKCDKCNGEKFNSDHKKYKICGYSIGEIMILPFDMVSGWIDRVRSLYNDENLEFSLSQIEKFVKKACELKIGYLFFNRNIPSLSGGELQRLRLIQILSSQLNDLLVVLDEPLAGLSLDEKQIVFENILDLSKKHTLLVVDHHDLFYKYSKNIIALGKGGGRNGGNIIDADSYIAEQSFDFVNNPPAVNDERRILIKSDVYSYKGVDINIAMNCSNIISGASGVGKSTLLREYLPQVFDKYLYISQKPITGNNRSTVASLLDITNKIVNKFSKEFHLDKSAFSNMACGKGCCPKCSGTGRLVYGNETQSQIVLECKDCRGTGYDIKLEKYKLKDKSILDISKMTVEEATEYFKSIDSAIYKTLLECNELLLGHLMLGEKTTNLSGGENIRIKLIKSLSTTSNVIGIDEPFKGLNNKEIYIVSNFINKMISKQKTIIVVDHEEPSFKYFGKHIIIKNINNILTGK